jgi:hypothetical protein
MEYIQIDNFNGNIFIITKDDGSGEPLIFDNLQEAQDTLEENCQNGIVVPLGVDCTYLIGEMYDAYETSGTLAHIGDLIANVLNLDDDVIFI